MAICAICRQFSRLLPAGIANCASVTARCGGEPGKSCESSGAHGEQDPAGGGECRPDQGCDGTASPDEMQHTQAHAGPAPF